MRRAPLGKIIGLLAGLAVASGPSSGAGGTKFTAAVSDSFHGDFSSAGRRIADAVRTITPRKVGAGFAVTLLGAEVSKANTKYIGFKADLPMGFKVRL